VLLPAEPFVLQPATKGSMFLAGKAIEVAWESTGLQEIPEVGGGDN